MKDDVCLHFRMVFDAVGVFCSVCVVSVSFPLIKVLKKSKRNAQSFSV